MSKLGTSMPVAMAAQTHVGSAVGPGAIARPGRALVGDVTPHIERLRARGAYQRLTAKDWDRNAARGVLDGYFKRTRPLTFRDCDFNIGLDFFLSNEADYASAIGSVDGRGGAFAGVGRCLPITYAAWQRASHAYVIDKKGIIPLGFIPVYALLLCIGAYRAELLSMLAGRPITNADGPRLENASPEKVADFVRSLPFDAGFARRISNLLSYRLADGISMSVRTRARDAVEGWMSKFRGAFSRRVLGFDNVMDVLLRTDSLGRGGVLSSEQALQNERGLFLEDRVTGLAADMVTGGLEAISSDIRRREDRLGAIYISNVEDLLLYSYLLEHKSTDGSTTPLRVQRYYDFYRRLLALPDARDAVVISAKKRKITSVDRLERYVRRSIPLELGVDAATNAAKDFYRLRTDVADLSRLPLEERLVRISKSSRSRHRFNVGFSVLRELFDGSPVDSRTLEERLAYEFRRAGMEQQPWWTRMFVSNVEELGLVRGAVNPS